MFSQKSLALLTVFFALLAGCAPAQTTPALLTQPPATPESTKTSTPMMPSPIPSPTPRSTFTPFPVSKEDEYAFAQNRRLGRGVNLGNALEAPSEGQWGVILQEEYFQLIQSAGFNSVRIPIRWSAHAQQTAPYTITPNFFKRVDWAVQQALSNHLIVILDLHHYEEMMQSPEEHKARFLAIWQQIAEHYKDYPDTVYFELLNEPNSALGTRRWSEIATETLAVVRETNPQRIVIIGPGQWNTIYELKNLKLPPEDRHLIVTFHYYSPFEFTHQGAEWVDGSNAWLGTTWSATPRQQRDVEMDFLVALNWSKENKRPIFLGEFGAYSKADMNSRALWTAFVARTAEQNGFSFAYWEFCAGFGVYDRDRGSWNEPLRKALIP